MPAMRAVRTSLSDADAADTVAFTVAFLIFDHKSTVNAVDILLILEAMVDIVAAKTAAMRSPARPAGSWLIMKKGKMASPLAIVMSSSAGCVLKKV